MKDIILLILIEIVELVLAVLVAIRQFPGNILVERTMVALIQISMQVKMQEEQRAQSYLVEVQVVLIILAWFAIALLTIQTLVLILVM